MFRARNNASRPKIIVRIFFLLTAGQNSSFETAVVFPNTHDFGGAADGHPASLGLGIPGDWCCLLAGGVAGATGPFPFPAQVAGSLASSALAPQP